MVIKYALGTPATQFYVPFKNETFVSAEMMRSLTPVRTPVAYNKLGIESTNLP